MNEASRPKLQSLGGQLFLIHVFNIPDDTPTKDSQSPPAIEALHAMRWSGSAFVEHLPGDARGQGISPTGGVIQNLAVSVDTAGRPFVAWQDARHGTPEVYVRGNTFNVGTIYFVNDASLVGDIATTAAGASGNTGLTPSSPKASVQQVLDTFNVNPGDVIFVDTGMYSAAITIGGDDEGATIIGAIGQTATFQQLVTVGVPNVTLERINLFGGATVTANNFTATDNRFYGALLLSGGDGAQLSHNLIESTLTLAGGVSGAIIQHNELGGNGDAIVVSGAVGITLLGNRILHDDDKGIRIAAPSSGIIRGNRIEGGDVGLDIAAAFSGMIEGNEISGVSIGVNYSAPAALSGNRIHGAFVGVESTVAGTTNGFGFVGTTEPNEIYDNTTGVQLTGQMRHQYIHHNTTGVAGSGLLDSGDLEHANRIEHNTTGVNFSGPVLFNRIANNEVGIVAVNGQLIAHNLIYRNAQTALRVQGRNDVRIFNNTFYAPAGDNIRIDGSSREVEIRNNILWAEAGYNIHVADNSTAGFWSDYNVLHASGTGKLVYWTRDFTDILDWQEDVFRFDLNSIGYTVVNPLWSEPRFFNRGNDDYRVFDQVARLRFTSPTMDAGDPRADQALPAYYNNLLTNPGFESGITGWTATPSGGTRSTNPTPWSGGAYFFAQSNAVTSVEQTVDLIAKGYTAAQIDNSNLSSVFGGRVRSAAEALPDRGELTLIYVDGVGTEINQITAKAVNVADRWELVGTRQPVPVGTRTVRLRFTAITPTGGENNSYLDSAFLYVHPNSEAPNLGGYGNTTHEQAQNLNQHLVMRSPDLYKDWERDKPLTIRWDSFGNTANGPVKIDLYQDGARAAIRHEHCSGYGGHG